MTRRGAVLDERARRWTSLPPLATDLQVGSFITAYRGRLAVAGYLQKPPENFDRATIDILDVSAGTWRHYEATGVTPMMDGFEIASDASAIVWSSGVDLTTFATLGAGGSVWRTLNESALELGSTGEVFAPIGHGRFLVEGGLLASSGDGQPNRPTPLGAILQLP